ncbi:MAG: hypothetical protein AAF490_07960 [Chloroflexota bacterium]
MYNLQKNKVINRFLLTLILVVAVFFAINAVQYVRARLILRQAVESGLKYAVTGRLEPAILDNGLPLGKYNRAPIEDGQMVNGDLRLVSIIYRTRNELLNLPINDDVDTEKSPYFYAIEIYGGDETYQLKKDFAGLPGLPVVIRVRYQMPLRAPIVNRFFPTVPIVVQRVANNELFGISPPSSEPVLPPIVPTLPTPEAPTTAQP